MDIDRIIIENVKIFRQERDISQRVLAEIIGTSRGFVSQVESPKSECRYSARQLYVIAKYFGCQVSDLFPPIDPLAP